MLTRCARWSQEQGGSEPELHYRHAIFYADDYHEFELEMSTPEDARVKVTVFPVLDIAVNIKTQIEQHLVKSTTKVKTFLEHTLHELRRIWTKGIMFDFKVACPCSGELHFLNLEDSLKQDVVKCTFSERVDTTKIRQRFSDDVEKAVSSIEEIETIHLGQKVERITCPVSSNGAELYLSSVGVNLVIPKGAIPTGQVVQVTLCLPDEEDYPPLDENHTLICPIVRCQPDGIDFLKPAILTLPTCAVQQDELLVTLWTKSSQVNGQWLKVWENHQCLNSSHELISIENNKVKVQLSHFSDDTVSAHSATDLEILVFQNPASLDNQDHVYISVYSVPHCAVSAVEIEQKEHQGVKCALNTTLQIQPNQNSLEISVSDILPKPGWAPPKEKKEISYQRLQANDKRSKCQFRFEKTRNEVNKIKGSVEARQAGNNDVVTEYFDVCLAPIARQESIPIDTSSKKKSVSPSPVVAKRQRDLPGVHTELTDDILLELSSSLTDDWLFLGLYLGNEQAHLKEYRSMEKTSGKPAAYCMLVSWRNGLRPDENGCEILQTALQEIGQPGLLDVALRSGLRDETTKTVADYKTQEADKSVGSFQTTGMKQVSDQDISDVVEVLKLDELKTLYEKLNLTVQDVEKAEAGANSTNEKLKAKNVLHHWRQINGRSTATKQTILDALEECRFIYAKETLQEMWEARPSTAK